MQKPDEHNHKNQSYIEHRHDRRNSPDSRPFLRHLALTHHTPELFRESIIVQKINVVAKTTVAAILRGQLAQLAKLNPTLTLGETTIELPQRLAFPMRASVALWIARVR